MAKHFLGTVPYPTGKVVPNPWEEDDEGWIEVWDTELEKIIELRPEDIDLKRHLDPEDIRK